jgi:hypothetical protein
MGTRDADHPIACGIRAQGTEQLGFFAPHHIRSIGVPLRDPRQNPDVTSLSWNRNSAFQDGREMCRCVDVSGFNPSLAGTRHAADNDRQVIRSADGIEMRLEYSREAELACRHHSFLAASLSQDTARSVDAPKPKAAGAPINCDVSSHAHFKSVLMAASAHWEATFRLFIMRGYHSVQCKSDPASSGCDLPPAFLLSLKR